ncbi:MAG: hypothetical protein JXR97_17160, partial [Planctomycetes bacterium]|nr:hypothetical protein [Planctomycetota bacterium]
MRAFLICFFAVCVLLPGYAKAENEKALVEITKDWSFTRTWKSAQKNKYHFYEGVLPLKNLGEFSLYNLSARLSILDSNGKLISKSDVVEFGDVKPGSVAKKKFIIEKAVQFSEVKVEINYEYETKTYSFEFSTPKAEVPPALLAKGGQEGLLELRILAEDIDRTILGKKQDKYSTLTMRIRNMATVAASKPTVIITFKPASGSDAAKKKSKKD